MILHYLLARVKSDCLLLLLRGLPPKTKLQNKKANYHQNHQHSVKSPEVH